MSEVQAETLEKPEVTISDKAVEMIKQVIEQQENKNLYLRLFVQPSGTGLSFGMALDTRKNSDDHSEIHESGIEVVIDHISFPYLKGASVSYTEGEKSGFSISSPNADLLAAAAGAACGSCAGDAGCCG